MNEKKNDFCLFFSLFLADTRPRMTGLDWFLHFFQYPPNDRIKVAFALLWRISVWIVGFALLWPTAGQAARKINDAGRDYVDANQIMAGLLGPGKKLYLMNYKTCRAHLNNRPLPSTLPEMLPSCSMIPHNLFQLCSLQDFRFIITASRRFLQRRLTS